MNSGIIRRIDDLGRVVIPREIRRKLHISDGDPIEIFVDTNKVVLKKYNELENLNDLMKRVNNEFTEIKDSLDSKISNDIIEHIDYLFEIFQKINKE